MVVECGLRSRTREGLLYGTPRIMIHEYGDWDYTNRIGCLLVSNCNLEYALLETL